MGDKEKFHKYISGLTEILEGLGSLNIFENVRPEVGVQKGGENFILVNSKPKNIRPVSDAAPHFCPVCKGAGYPEYEHHDTWCTPELRHAVVVKKRVEERLSWRRTINTTNEMTMTNSDVIRILENFLEESKDTDDE